MRTAQKGFTLAELLIALALLGLIAAFTIPKVLQATGNQATAAKMKETVSTLEQSWENQVLNNALLNGSTLYDNIRPHMNAIDAGSGAPAATYAASKCGTATFKGYVLFANGVFVSGLANGPNIDSNLADYNQASSNDADNYELCIDLDGTSGANSWGVDTFVGNFNQWGAFTAASGVNNTQGQQAYNWNTPVYTEGGTSADAVTTGGSTGYVEYILKQ